MGNGVEGWREMMMKMMMMIMKLTMIMLMRITITVINNDNRHQCCALPGRRPSYGDLKQHVLFLGRGVRGGGMVWKGGSGGRRGGHGLGGDRFTPLELSPWDSCSRLNSYPFGTPPTLL